MNIPWQDLFSMRRAGLVLMVTSIGLASLTSLMAKKEVDQYRAALSTERALSAQVVPTEEIYVSARPLRYGERLTLKDVRPVRWPSEAIPEGAFLVAQADLFPPEGPDYRNVLRAMEAGEAVLSLKVTAPGAEAGVSARLTPGQRAFAIQVDVQTGVSGLLRPGDRVDIYWTGQASGSSGLVTRLIAATVQIIAIDQSADMDTTKPAVARTITIQTSPQQVASLTQAQATGRLSLSLVGGSDSIVAATSDVEQSAFIVSRDLKVEAPRDDKTCTVTTRRAGEKTTETPIVCRN